ncbi:MAG: 4Fe-4S binding protein [Deltaproteobacteria bacterium]
MKIVVDEAKCTGSGECIVMCPQKALSLEEGKAVLDEDKCDLDGICIPACPNHAITFSEEE